MTNLEDLTIRRLIYCTLRTTCECANWDDARCTRCNALIDAERLFPSAYRSELELYVNYHAARA